MQKIANLIIDCLEPDLVAEDILNKISENSHLIALGKPASHYTQFLCKKKEFKSVLSYTKFGHRVEANFSQWEGSHPIPTKENLQKTKDLRSYLNDKKNITFIITGGASSLLVDPKIDWDSFIKVWKSMLNGGWGIEEMNKVRILMSNVKGGGLLRGLQNTSIKNFYISDVPSNHFDLVSSSPTQSVLLDMSEIDDLIGKFENDELKAKLAQLRQDYEPQDYLEVESFLILSAENLKLICLDILTKEFPEYEIEIDQEIKSEDIKNFKQRIPNLKEKQIWVSIGEASVDVSASGGEGGRNSHLVCEMALVLKANQAFFSLATDGNDGASSLAGGFVEAFKFNEQDLRMALKNFDTASYLRKQKTSLSIPAGLTNLMDIRCLISH